MTAATGPIRWDHEQREDDQQSASRVTTREDPPGCVEEQELMNCLRERAVPIKRLTGLSTECAFPDRQWTSDPEPGFRHDDSDHEQMDTANPSILYPRPAGKVSGQDQDQTKDNRGCIQEMRDHDNVSQDCRSFRAHIRQIIEPETLFP